MITVIGSINLDLITVVDRLPKPGETVGGSSFRTAPGGKGANQALAASRAGAEVRMIGAVGGDAFAGEALALLRQAALDLSGVKTGGDSTGTALILVDGKGENVIAIAPGANGSVGAGDIPGLSKSETILLQHEIPLETIEAALDRAAKSGARAILNTAPFQADAAKLLAKAAIVVANETEFDLYAEALGLAGEDREARMAEFARDTGRTIIVTLGADGALAYGPDGRVAVSSIEVTVVDTVGAGDTFCGYLAAGLDAGLELEQAMRRAAVAGALACTRSGAQPSIPTRQEVDGRTA